MHKLAQSTLVIIAAGLLLILMLSAPLVPGDRLRSGAAAGVLLATIAPSATSEAGGWAGLFAPDPSATPTATPLPEGLAIATPEALGPRGQAINAYLTSLTDARLFQGSVLVALQGRIALARGYGMADVARGVPNTSQTRFRLASLTKAFTAAGIMILQQRGLVDLNASICTYLDDCPDLWRGITVHHLLSHTSGVPNYTDFLDFEPTEMNHTTPDALVARFRGAGVSFAPGSAYAYGNSAYVLAGRIIERVSGRPYADFIRDEIFIPLGMRASGYDTSMGGYSPELAIGYNNFDEPASFIDVSTLDSAGALFSTVEDMYRWDRALASDQLLGAEQRTRMFTPGLRDYGYGWRIARPSGLLMISHPGDMTGASTYVSRFPEVDATVIVLSNMYWADAVGIGDHIANLLLGN